MPHGSMRDFFEISHASKTKKPKTVKRKSDETSFKTQKTSNFDNFKYFHMSGWTWYHACLDMAIGQMVPSSTPPPSNRSTQNKGVRNISSVLARI